MGKLIDKMSSYLVVSYYKQPAVIKFGLVICYGMAALILCALLLATVGLLTT